VPICSKLKYLSTLDRAKTDAKVKVRDNVEHDKNQPVIGVEIKMIEEHARSAINAIMVRLYSDQVMAIVKNVEMNFCLLKREEELLKVDANF